MIFANTFTLAGVEGTFAPGVYVVEAMEGRAGAMSEADDQCSRVTITRRASDLFASFQRMEVEAGELEAALTRDRESGETET